MVLVAIDFYSLFYFAIPRFQNAEIWDSIKEFFNSGFFQAVVITAVGFLGFKGVMKQIKSAEDRAETARDVTHRNMAILLKEDMRVKLDTANIIIDVINAASVSYIEKWDHIRKEIETTNFNNNYWVAHPNMLVGINKENLEALSAIRRLTTQLDQLYKNPEFIPNEFYILGSIRPIIYFIRSDTHRLIRKLQ
ncbi:MAG: hypothetical protein V7740_15215 [Pseudomonas marincola]